MPELVGALHRPLGEILDIRINWSVTDGQIALETIATGGRMMRAGDSCRRPRVMVLVGRAASAKLVVVPSTTPQALGVMVLRMAAGLLTSSGIGDARLFEIASMVMRLAADESTK